MKGAGVVRNKIVYFVPGSYKVTYVLEEGEKGNLEVTSRFPRIDYIGEGDNSPFCIFAEKIYFFPTNQDSEVWCLDVEAEQSYLFLRNDSSHISQQITCRNQRMENLSRVLADESTNMY